MDADDECFELLSTLPEHVKYVVVLTKMDKTRGVNYNIRIVEDIRRTIDLRLGDNDEIKKREVPIIMTSATTKQGGVDAWLQILKGITADE